MQLRHHMDDCSITPNHLQHNYQLRVYYITRHLQSNNTKQLKEP